MIKEPPLNFTPWTRWEDRNSVKNAHLPGVYVLARWGSRPPAAVDPLAQAVVYAGEVSEGSLMGRWQQFHRAAFESKPGHAGGLLYGEIFGTHSGEEEEREYGQDGQDGQEGERLYVAAFVPEGLSREMRSLYIRYIERKLVWDYARRWGSPPVCNAR